MTVDVRDLVDALERNSGRHPGYRRAQARGVCATGVFTPTGDAAHLTTAVPFRDEPTRVTVRFSNAEGNPAVPDYARVVHGLSVKFHRDTGDYGLISVSVPSFLARTPAEFAATVDAI